MQSIDFLRGISVPGKVHTLLRLTSLLLCLVCSVVLPQSFPQQAYSALQWRLVGPFRGGRAIAAAGIPGNPYTFYFGGVDGGMWKTTNAGVTWESISEGLTNPSIGAFAIAPSNPKIIVAGTGEADIRSDITYGNGVYISTDGASHWEHVGLDDTRHIGRVLIDPKNPDLILVAALGHAYGPNEQRGIFRTTDGGKNWQKVLYTTQDVGAIDLAWDPSEPRTIYGAMWEARRTPWSQYPPNEGTGSGLYKSPDEGVTWFELSGNGLPPKPYGRIGLAVGTGSRGKIVYALLNAQKEGSGLYRSDDEGVHWRLTSKDANITTRMWYFGIVAVSPRNSEIVYVPNRSLLRSIDGGKTFSVIKGAPGGDDYHYLWIDPENDQRMIVASDQGTSVSVDNGATWSSWYNQPTGQFYHVTTDDQFPYRIYGSQQDMGTASVTSRSDFGLITFRDWYPVGAEESGYIAVDPANPNIVYGGGPYGGAFRFDRTTGQSQNISPSALSTFSTPAPLRKYRFTWTSPIVFDRHEPHTLYMGSQVLLRTQDGGLHWQPMSPDLTGADPKSSGKSGPPTIADASLRGWGVVYTIAPSSIQAGLIWVGTDDGLVHITRDAGQHWENVTPKDLPPWSKISLIEASPFDPSQAYAAIDRHRLDDFAPYIYVTKDYGQHWSRADKGIGPLAYVQVVRCDLTRKGLLYAGTETGVFVSFNDGDNWQSLQLNLPMASVRDLAVHDNDLVAATHGRAFWILDNLTPLQQLSESIVGSNVYLFQPERAIRIRRTENRDTPLPPEEPHGTNPPAGVVFDYYLGTNSHSALKLDILDEAGNLVRSFSSDDQFEKPVRPPYFAQAWLPKFAPLGVQQGHNRFVWDLQYPPPPSKQHDYNMNAIADQGTEREPQGPLVLPGRYQAKITVDGHSSSQSFEVTMDPRVQVSEAELKDQIILAVGIWNAMSDQYSLSNSVESLNRQLSALEKKPELSSAVRSSVHSLLEKAGSLRDSLNDGGLANLETVVMSADRQPTEQVREGFETLNSKLTHAKMAWEELTKKVLFDLNRNLKPLGISELNVPTHSAHHLIVRE